MPVFIHVLHFLCNIPSVPFKVAEWSVFFPCFFSKWFYFSFPLVIAFIGCCNHLSLLIFVYYLCLCISLSCNSYSLRVLFFLFLLQRFYRCTRLSLRCSALVRISFINFPYFWLPSLSSLRWLQSILQWTFHFFQLYCQSCLLLSILCLFITFSRSVFIFHL